MEAYVEGVTGQETSRSAAARLHVLTGGNPFFLGEVLRLVEPEGLGEAKASGPGAPASPRRYGCCCGAGSADLSPGRHRRRSAWPPWQAGSSS